MLEYQEYSRLTEQSAVLIGKVLTSVLKATVVAVKAARAHVSSLLIMAVRNCCSRGWQEVHRIKLMANEEFGRSKSYFFFFFRSVGGRGKLELELMYPAINRSSSPDNFTYASVQ